MLTLTCVLLAKFTLCYIDVMQSLELIRDGQSLILENTLNARSEYAALEDVEQLAKLVSPGEAADAWLSNVFSLAL